jgi:tRNA(Ile)-lysidine synthase TilS/MesJ
MLHIPPVITAALERGAAVAVSVSGGKDSQAMERVLAGLREKHHWPGPFFAIHADVGQPFDWPWTLALCERNAQALATRCTSFAAARARCWM